MALSQTSAMLGFGGAAALVSLAVVALAPRLMAEGPTARLRRRARTAMDGAAPATVTTDEPSVFASEMRGVLGSLQQRSTIEVIRLGGWPVARMVFLVTILAGVIAAMAMAAVFEASARDTAIAAVAATATVGWLVAGQCRRRWRIAYLENLSDAIDLVIRAVKAGIPVIEALKTAGREVNEPVRGEFARITEEVDLGGDLKVALRRSATRVGIADVDFFVVCLILQRETGGQLAETLQGLTTILRRRKELRLKTRALTAEGRLSVAIVGAIPVLAGLGMYAMNPAYMGQLLEPGLGRTMLYIAMAAHLSGMLIAHRLTQVQP